MKFYVTIPTFLLCVLINNIIAECNSPYLIANISQFLPKELQAAPGLYFIEKFPRKAEYCVNSKSICCTDDLFKIFTAKLNLYLHQLSGLHKASRELEILQKNYYDFVLGSMERNIVNVFLDLNIEFEDEAIKLTFQNIHDFLIKQLSSSLYNTSARVDIKQAIQNALMKVKYQTNCISDVMRMNNESMEIVAKSLESMMKENFEDIYWYIQMLSKFLTKSQILPPSEICTKQMTNMIFCGVCSSNIDWTLYSTYSATNQIKTSRPICPMFCKSTIYSCLSGYFQLNVPLKHYKQTMRLHIETLVMKLRYFDNYWLNQSFFGYSFLGVVKNITLYLKEEAQCSYYSNKGHKLVENSETTRTYQLKELPAVQMRKFFMEFIRIVNSIGDNLNSLSAKCNLESNRSCWNGSVEWKFSRPRHSAVFNHLMSILTKMTESLQKNKNIKDDNVYDFEGSGAAPSGRNSPDDEDIFSVNRFSKKNDESIQLQSDLVTTEINIKRTTSQSVRNSPEDEDILPVKPVSKTNDELIQLQSDSVTTDLNNKGSSKGTSDINKTSFKLTFISILCINLLQMYTNFLFIK